MFLILFPAIFAIITDPLVVYTSNVFTILGLRNPYFLLEGAVRQFYYPQTGFSFILIFAGTKMLIADFIKIDAGIFLIVVLFILILVLAVSWIKFLYQRPYSNSSP